MLAYRYTVGLCSILLVMAGEGESERYLLIRERGRGYEYYARSNRSDQNNTT